MSLFTHRLVLLCVNAYCFRFWDLPGDVLAAPESALCGWIGVILLSVSSLSLVLGVQRLTRLYSLPVYVGLDTDTAKQAHRASLQLSLDLLCVPAWLCRCLLDSQYLYPRLTSRVTLAVRADARDVTYLSIYHTCCARQRFST